MSGSPGQAWETVQTPCPAAWKSFRLGWDPEFPGRGRWYSKILLLGMSGRERLPSV